MIRSSLALAFALVGVLPVFGGDQPTIITGSDEFEFVYRVKLPSIDGKARLWMPLARTDAFQTVRSMKSASRSNGRKCMTAITVTIFVCLIPARRTAEKSSNCATAYPKREERLPCD